MKRLFTFGCSFTQWNWPTWADILAKNYDYFENWALSGIGNQAIAERISECVLANKLTKDDTVIVQWTDFHRFDAHRHSSPTSPAAWRQGGSLLVNPDESTMVLAHWNERSYVYHTTNFINLAYNLLKNTDCNFKFVSRVNLRPDIVKFVPQHECVLDFPEWTHLSIQEFCDSTGYKGRPFRYKFTTPVLRVPTTKEYIDLHPTTRIYAQWAEKALGAKVDWKFVEHSESVLAGITDWAQLNTEYEAAMGWKIGGNVVLGF